MFKHSILKHLNGRRKTPLVSCAILCTILILSVFPASVGAKNALSEGTLRQAVSEIQSLDVGVVDKASSLSSIEGKDILFVDGNFYLESNRAVSKKLQSEALDGTPVVFVGPGFEGFCVSLNIGFKEPVTEDGVELPIAAYGLKILSQRTSEGAPVISLFSFGGNDSQLSSDVIQSVIEWYENDIKIDNPSNASSGAIIIMSGEDIWNMEEHRRDSLNWSPHGIITVDTSMYRQLNESVPDEDFFFLHINKELAPGKHVWGNDWRNNLSFVDIDINDDPYAPPSQHINAFDPKFEPGTSYYSVNLGINALYGTWEYQVTDNVLEIEGGMYADAITWINDINEGTSSGENPVYYQPGFKWSQNVNAWWYAYATPYYKAEWGDPGWPWWDYWESPWIGLPVFYFYW